MSMIKIVSPHGWDFDQPVASLIKISSRGLIGEDRRTFIKRAGHAFMPFIDQLKIARDEEPVHLIALGASEAYSANRNGDGFKEATCKRCHETFEKFARAYRNHKNKNPDISYGIVKKSAYNDIMRRVELLVYLNKTKEAAARNGGFVADKELEKLARGDDLSVSMACRVPFDVCSFCGNRARTRDEYCTSEKCAAGGCKDNLTRLVKIGADLHHLHVDNPDPVWFDISHVYRPADRIAYGTRADWLDKAASDGAYGVSSTKLAEELGVTAPLTVILAQDTMYPDEWTGYVQSQVKLAHGLALLESMTPFNPEIGRAFTGDMQPPLDLDAFSLSSTSCEKVASVLGAMADQSIILSLRDFARLSKRAELSDDATGRLHGVYGRMIDDGSLERCITGNTYALSEKLASAAQRHLAERLKPIYSVDQEHVTERAQLSTLRHYVAPACAVRTEKKASDSPEAEKLARDYAVYKVAALRRIASFDNSFLLTAKLSLHQNGVV